MKKGKAKSIRESAARSFDTGQAVLTNKARTNRTAYDLGFSSATPPQRKQVKRALTGGAGKAVRKSKKKK